jgi:hypothetical protein
MLWGGLKMIVSSGNYSTVTKIAAMQTSAQSGLFGIVGFGLPAAWASNSLARSLAGLC